MSSRPPTRAGLDRLSSEPVMRRRAVATLILVIAGLLGWQSAFRDGLTSAQVEWADSTADLLVARAFVDGVDPYQDIFVLAERYDISYRNSAESGEGPLSHPRTPGALVLLAPSSGLSPDTMLATVLAASVLAAIGVAWSLAVFLRLSLFALIAVLAYSLLLGPAKWSFLFGTQSHLLMLATTVFVLALLRDNEIVSGLALAFAATLKVFPLVIIVVLLAHKKHRAVVACLVAFGLLNVLPLALPHMTLAGAWAALTSASGNWEFLSSNIGLGAALQRTLGIGSGISLLISAAALAATLAAAVRRGVSLERATTLAITSALLFAPLSWPHYLLVVVPFVALTLTLLRPVGWVRLTLGVGFILTALLYQTLLITVGLVLVVGSLALGRFEVRPPALHLPSRSPGSGMDPQLESI